MNPPNGTIESGPVVAGLLLAAGGGRRLGGRPKALLSMGGQPLVERTAEIMRAGGCAPLHVVLGADADEVNRRTRLDGCRVVVNADWARGMGGSLRVGLASLTATDAGAALVMLVDQPRIGSEAVARLIAAHRAGASLAAAAYDGERGHPVLFARRHWPEVTGAARDDRGARDFLRAHAAQVTLVECGDVASPEDVDTPEDLGLLD
ncbi:Nicotine blue oxidoreductase [Streptomyces sp. RB5]|uniref:Nicotine blue oxidoreductase n=1 Tax=Streptomyces smaragdinus TaxID=2585196 RepID=A0A7K0CM44_9ACTN|nr:nucleotidyltransferase family protein [Streptomyces smaragdinus]MQY14558.1 Nicotine blue oxidoreductase [Streptomyces smaragdinus]